MPASKIGCGRPASGKNPAHWIFAVKILRGSSALDFSPENPLRSVKLRCGP
jgi:hypothetical protein